MKKNNFQFLVFLFAVAALFSNCDQKAAQSSYDKFELGQAFDLGVDKSAQLNGGDLTIKFTGVKSDSRCPEGVECIQAGSVTVTFTANGKELTLTKEGKQKGGVYANSGGYKIELIEVNPYPKNGVKTEKGDYSVNLKVTK